MNMNLAENRYVPRLLGGMFLAVIAMGVVSGSFLTPLNYAMTGPPTNITETLLSFAKSSAMVQLSILGYLFESVAIVLLSVLLYAVLGNQNRVFARWACALWLIEAVAIVLREISAFSLLFTAREFASAGAMDLSYFHTLGRLFYKLMHFSYDAQMIFYCVGGIVFYYLFLKSKYVPQALAIFGIAVASLGLVGEVVAILGYDVPLFVFLPILPFELGIGLWLLIKGIPE